MLTDNEKCCGNCVGAVKAAARNMDGFIWCPSGNAARRSGISCVQACFVSPRHAACSAFKMREGALAEAPTYLIGKSEQRPDQPSANAQPETKSAEPPGEVVPPWDQASNVGVAGAQTQPSLEENHDKFFL